MFETRNSRRAFLGTAAGMCLLSVVARAHAQMAVIDPTNLAQNILQVARAIEQINNQIRQIEQQAQMLSRSSLQLSPELSQSILEARTLFDAVSGVAFQAGQVGENLRELYPETYEEFDLENVLARSDRWMAQSRHSLELAMEAEAEAVRAIEAQRGRLEAALDASSSAEGQTSAIQASNQLLGVSASQLAQIQALLVAQGRALQIERMERLAREERAAEIRRRAFPAGRRNVPPARTAF